MTHIDTVLFWFVGLLDAVLFGTWVYEWVLKESIRKEFPGSRRYSRKEVDTGEIGFVEDKP